jgi:hypothetical protein
VCVLKGCNERELLSDSCGENCFIIRGEKKDYCEYSCPEFYKINEKGNECINMPCFERKSKSRYYGCGKDCLLDYNMKCVDKCSPNYENDNNAGSCIIIEECSKRSKRNDFENEKSKDFHYCDSDCVLLPDERSCSNNCFDFDNSDHFMENEYGECVYKNCSSRSYFDESIKCGDGCFI